MKSGSVRCKLVNTGRVMLGKKIFAVVPKISKKLKNKFYLDKESENNVGEM